MKNSTREKISNLYKLSGDLDDSGEQKLSALLQSKIDESDTTISELTGKLEIPIGVIEKNLHTFFPMRWGTQNFKYLFYNGRCIASLELFIVSPFTERKLTFVGACDIPDNSQSFDLGDEKVEVYSTLPIAKAMCLKNGVKQLGNHFGADFGRGFKVPYVSASVKALPEDGSKNYLLLKKEIESLKDIEEAREKSGKLVIKIERWFNYKGKEKETPSSIKANQITETEEKSLKRLLTSKLRDNGNAS